MDSLSLYRSEKAFGYAVGINSGSEGIRKLEKAEGVCNVVFLVLARESVEEKGDVRELEREWACGLISERIGE